MGFWDVIDLQCTQLRGAKTADDVIEILNRYESPSAGDAFFAGSGGDTSVSECLTEAGWHYIWSEADYYWVMQAPEDGSLITYIEGDIYRGDKSVRQYKGGT